MRNGQDFVQGSELEEDMSVQETGSGFSEIISARSAIGVTASGKLVLMTISVLLGCWRRRIT